MDAKGSIIFFDDECILCSRSVQFMLRIDHKRIFRFASIHHMYAKERIGVVPSSIVLIVGEKIYTQSEAIIRIAILLGSWYRAAGILLLIPSFIRDPVYRFIARHRYKWFGKSNQCFVPDSSLADRFL